MFKILHDEYIVRGVKGIMWYVHKYEMYAF